MFFLKEPRPGGSRENSSDLSFMVASCVTVPLYYFLLHARSDFVGSFSLSRIEVLEHSGRSHNGGITGTGSISLSPNSSASAMPF